MFWFLMLCVHVWLWFNAPVWLWLSVPVWLWCWLVSVISRVADWPTAVGVGLTPVVLLFLGVWVLL